MKAPCEFCGEDVNLDVPGYYYEVRGWALKRADGGTHAVRLQQSLSRVAHGPCLDLRIKGGEQTSLV